MEILKLDGQDQTIGKFKVVWQDRNIGNFKVGWQDRNIGNFKFVDGIETLESLSLGNDKTPEGSVNTGSASFSSAVVKVGWKV